MIGESIEEIKHAFNTIFVVFGLQNMEKINILNAFLMHFRNRLDLCI